MNPNIADPYLQSDLFVLNLRVPHSLDMLHNNMVEAIYRVPMVTGRRLDASEVAIVQVVDQGPSVKFFVRKDNVYLIAFKIIDGEMGPDPTPEVRTYSEQIHELRKEDGFVLHNSVDLGENQDYDDGVDAGSYSIVKIREEFNKLVQLYPGYVKDTKVIKNALQVFFMVICEGARNLWISTVYSRMMMKPRSCLPEWSTDQFYVLYDNWATFTGYSRQVPENAAYPCEDLESRFFDLDLTLLDVEKDSEDEEYQCQLRAITCERIIKMKCLKISDFVNREVWFQRNIIYH